MTNLRKQFIVNKIQKAINSAQSDYKNYADNLVCFAPEYLLTIYIYQSLKNNATLEECPKNIHNWSGKNNKCNYPKAIRANGRCDLTLWPPNGPAQAVIEVKRNLDDYLADVRRLSKMIKIDPNLELSVLACCIHRKVNNSEYKTRVAIKNYLNKIEQIIKSAVGEGLNVELQKHPIRRLSLSNAWAQNEREWLWRPVCFVFDLLN